MKAHHLNAREQRLLEETERHLTGDRSLRWRLRLLGGACRARHLQAAALPGRWALAVAAVVSLVLLFTGIATGNAGVIWAFALCWLVTWGVVLRVAYRWATTHLGSDDKRKPYV
ncbi:hypothetical protein ACH4E8_28300 [Streptomyces sp. NPDC017979]|uniref:hypothetical protein n=1 Tax=unclassified Streptomyces TaxID=2593676 RepID=UPI0037BA379C